MNASFFKKKEQGRKERNAGGCGGTHTFNPNTKSRDRQTFRDSGLSDGHSESLSQDCEVGPCFKEEEEGKKKCKLFSFI